MQKCKTTWTIHVSFWVKHRCTAYPAAYALWLLGLALAGKKLL